MAIPRDAITEVPVHELIRKRWSPRAFKPEIMPESDQRALLEAARWAPSCFNEQPWVFFVADRGSPERWSRMLSILVDFNQEWAKNASLLLLSVAKLNFSRNGKPNPHAWHDVGLATAQLILQAQSLGYYSHAMAGFDGDKARSLFGIPDGYEPVAATAVGRIGDPATLPPDMEKSERAARERHSLSSFVFTERFSPRPS